MNNIYGDSYILLTCAFYTETIKFKDSGDGSAIAGTIALIGWCIYFIPVAILSVVHFRKAMNFRQMKRGKDEI